MHKHILLFSSVLLASGCSASMEDQTSETEEEVTYEADGARCTVGTAYQTRVKDIIREAFGSVHAKEAIRVAQCESGPWGTKARNGQYEGLFQMGSWERAHYGHSRCAEKQARAAHAYFVATGKTWSPWECKP